MMYHGHILLMISTVKKLLEHSMKRVAEDKPKIIQDGDFMSSRKAMIIHSIA